MNTITIDKTIRGTILDIGGGGEGIIGSIYQSQVTAIDNRQEELDEAPEGFIKLLMDACNLEFGDESFENVTLFYTLMYIKKEQQSKVIQEAYRVLEKKGHFYIWDSIIKIANPFIVSLRINADGSIINADYGVYKQNAYQDDVYFKAICENVGFKLVENFVENNQFYLHFTK